MPSLGRFDGSPRFALLVVNASTTRYVELMLCTLAEQSRLGIVHQLVIVDNRSRDGGVGFLRALAGEIRPAGPNPRPDIQASFFAVRRDVYERRDVEPLQSGGSPACGLQQSHMRLGLPVVCFPGNRGGHVLHRGRSAVAAAGVYTPRRAYASVASNTPHFMGVPGGERIWAEIEAQHAQLLSPPAEHALLEHLAAAFTRFGDPADAGT